MSIVIQFEDTEILIAATTTHNVGPGLDFLKIQDAIDSANPGDEIFVHNGEYYEHLTILKENLTLRGEDPAKTIINGIGSIGDVISVQNNKINITGFTITGSGAEWGEAGIKLFRVRNCWITNNIITANNYSGIKLYYSNNNSIIDNKISNNNESGIFLHDSADNNISSNEITPNNLVGLSISASKHNRISNNDISKNNLLGIDIIDSSENTLEDNVFSRNKGNAIEFWNASNNIFIENEISFNNGDGIHLQSSKANTFENNTIIENGFSIGSYWVEHWDTHKIPSSNTVNGKPVYYWAKKDGGTVPLGAGQVILANCKNVEVKDQDISKTSEGIVLGFSSGNNITNNKLNTNSRYGVTVWRSNNNTISKNTIASNKDFGISIIYSDGNILDNNTLSKNKDGIELRASKNHKLSYNKMISDGLFITGNLFDGWRELFSDEVLDGFGNVLWRYSIDYWNTHDISTTNIIGNKPIIYWKDKTEGTVPANAGQVILANCRNIQLKNQNISIKSVPIAMGFSLGNTLFNNIATSAIWHGIYLESSEGNKILNSTVYSSIDGIYLDNSQKNNITENEIYLNQKSGILLKFSNKNAIFKNNISNNAHGLRIEYSNNNSISRNNFVTNNDYGVNLGWDTQDNIVFLNNFVDNNIQASDSGDNFWNDEYPTGGNYWDDYVGIDVLMGLNQNETGTDGIGDAPYDITIGGVNAFDEYPLMVPFEKGKLIQTPPTPPRNLKAETHDEYVVITWLAPSYDGGTPIIQFNIYRGVTEENLNLYTNILINTTEPYGDYSFINLNVTLNHTYYYKVSAVNKIGESLLSNIANATPVPILYDVPTAPQNLSAKSGDSYVVLLWDPPTSDGGAAINWYNIYRGNSSENITIFDTIDNATMYNDTYVTNNITYYYLITAVNVAGEGENSSRVTAKPGTSIKPHKTDGDDDDSVLFLFIGLLIIIIWVIIIITIFLLMRRKIQNVQKIEPEKEPELKSEKTETSEKKK